MKTQIAVSESARALGAKMRHALAVALWNARGNRKTAKAVERVASYVCHRLEYPRFRKLREGSKDSARIMTRAGKGWRKRVILDKQRLGFREIRLSEWDREEIRGAVSLVHSGAIPSTYDRDGKPQYESGPALWGKPLGLKEWQTLFRVARAALRMDSMDGAGARSRKVSLQELESLAHTDFHSGLAAGHSACDLDRQATYGATALDILAAREQDARERSLAETGNRARYARLARDFRNGLRFAFHASPKGRKAARREWLANLGTLRLAARAVGGAGHGLDMRRKDGKGTRSLHARIGRFSAYVAQGWLVEAGLEREAALRETVETALRITLTATAHC